MKQKKVKLFKNTLDHQSNLHIPQMVSLLEDSGDMRKHMLDKIIGGGQGSRSLQPGNGEYAKLTRKG
jgi:hypothetical protein